MMVPLVFRGFLAILNGFLGAPLNTGEALFASVKPGWLFIAHLNIVGRADFRADPATIAFLVHPKILIQFANTWER